MANTSLQRALEAQKRETRPVRATPMPDLPNQVRSEIRRAVEESNRRIMKEVRPQVRKAIRDAIKKSTASKR